MPNSKIVLVPSAEIGISLIQILLSDKANVIGVKDFHQAINLANKDIHLIVCGLSFADSQMFEFLRAIKANAKTNSIPFLCFNAVHTGFSKTILEAVTIASKSLGAIGFVDFWSLVEKYGTKDAENIFQGILIDLLTTGFTQENLNDLPIGLGQHL